MNSSHKKQQPGRATRTRLDPECIALMRLVDALRYADVEAAARRILASRQTHPLALKALGFALIGQARYDEALPIVAFAVERNPGDPESHNNHGIVLSALMRWDESIKCFNRSIEIKPDDPEVLKNYGVALARMQKYDEAVPYFLKAIASHPGDYVEAIEQLAGALLASHRNDEAWTCLNELWKNDNSNVAILSQLLGASLKRCDWDELPARLLTLSSLSHDYHSLTDNPFVVFSFPGVGSEEQRRVAENFARSRIPASVLDAANDQPVLYSEAQDSRRRLRIGYLSADYRNHPVGLIMPQVPELHDRSKVEVFGYSMGVDDHSDIRQRLSAAFDHFVDLRECSVSETAERIRADRIEILIDLQGWTSDGRPEALALRCAPVQVNWLGYAGTIGHPRLADYLLGDPMVTPLHHGPYYTETIAHLPGCYLPADSTIALSAPPSRREAGLPENGFVYCSFNNSYKFNPLVFDLWCRLLRDSDDSCLWLSQPAESSADRLRNEAQARGVDPGRLVFAPRVASRVDHLSRLQLADLALDPFPYNSHSTGIDVLWAGVPMVALLGDTFPGRVGASVLRAAGLDELIAGSVDEYYRLAMDLFGNPQRLQGLRRKLAENKHGCPLFDMPRFVSSLEDVYFRMWDNHLQGTRMPLV
ncbi:MAG: tetratricopeptide repeat protein [Candidatus Accumulibacter sp.]|uniref:O-linked N-acetylglucosamine transferase, SPINDLY family protein n=1 Tax=Accumulibacter sp. TaxID=2053492 RepID=UPI002588C1A6|nr:tetratricopeptide repeat protein [Accumulibacter sp.]MBK8114049.1 tetratricopeptide repeat protein [Accumulibacter sp.]